MTPEAWSIIATGIVVLIAIAASNRSLRGEIGQLRAGMQKLNERISHVESSLTERISQVETSLNERISQVESSLNERMSQLETSLTERMHRMEVELRERLARVEGTLGTVHASINRGRQAEPNVQRPGAGSK